MSFKKKWWVLVIVLVIILAGLFYFLRNNFSGSNDFSKTSLIRMNLPLGGEINNTIKITNPSKNQQIIKISFNDFEGLASLTQDELILEPKETKNLILNFKDEKKVPGVYVGKLILQGAIEKDEIPIILGVEDPNHAFAIIQTSIPQYDEVFPGGKLGLELKVFDLSGSNVQTVKSSYVIKDLNDETILNGNSDLIVGTSGKTEIINIPSEWAEGDYVFISYVDYKGTLSFSSYLFSVSSPGKNDFFANSSVFLIGVVVFVVLILGLVIYFINTRDSLLIQLRKQQEAEIKRNLKCIQISKKAITQSKEKPEKKKVKLEVLEKAKKNIIARIKKKQANQKKEIKNLKKTKVKKNILNDKLSKWKNEGYKLYETDDEIKKITHKSVKDHVDEWKRQGYDTSFLEK
jgi:preprotein translocase subunit SecF